ncbi:MAG TPA: PAS domain-containing sensor histidine kinase [Thermomicrobiales bacterium]|nr:PAS domain-containing sensor histidine kinase [Thermomicrobiales bacterium]
METSLRKSQARHQLALLAGGLGSWELDLQTMVLESSDSCKANMGLGPHDQISYARLLEVILPEDRPAMQASVQRAVETGGDYQADYRVQWPDGSIHWIAAYGRPFFAADGTPERMLGTTQEVTERKQAEQERERLLREARNARDEAQRAVQLRDTFLSSTVHDLRNPLTSMRGRTQLLQRRISKLNLADADRQRLEDGLAQIEVSTGQIQAILAELQDMAFLQIGRPLELKCAPTDLVALVQSAIDQHRLQARRHEVRFDTSHEHLIAAVDPTRIERVITNLLSNAVKYSPGGGRVTVSLWGDETGVALAVSDEGIGIPAGELGLIFERYRRGTNVTKSFEGTGIGLSGSRQIVEQHGGAISVDSEEGKGSRFTVRLPIDVVHENPPHCTGENG